MAVAGPLLTPVCDGHFPCPRYLEEVTTGALQSLSPGSVSDQPVREDSLILRERAPFFYKTLFSAPYKDKSKNP